MFPVVLGRHVTFLYRFLWQFLLTSGLMFQKVLLQLSGNFPIHGINTMEIFQKATKYAVKYIERLKRNVSIEQRSRSNTLGFISHHAYM